MTTYKTDPAPFEIKTNEPQTVYVHLFQLDVSNPDLTPGFALHRHDTYFTGGINWQIQKGDTIHDQYAMFVTFILSDNVKKLEGDFWYSPVYRHDDQRRTRMSIPYATWKAGSHFGVVHRHDHRVIDPKS